jgi:murein DD-endopeptidase MepM/ murein hydrolase activator NlpD
VSPSSAQVLERPGVQRDTPAAPVEEREVHAAAPAVDKPRRRRLAHPPGRRAPLWFTALVAGALLAAAPSVFGGPAGPTAVASDYGLGAASQLGLTGELDDAGARRSITEAEAQARLGELAASRAARAPKTVLPTQGRLTTCFCMRWGQMHWGIDLAAPLGTPIYAATDGVVLRAGPATGFGNAVYIQDADGNVHIYGHMRYYNVRAGDVVSAGDQIAKVGNQGQSTGPHLHYEIHRGGMQGRRIDPQKYLSEHGVEV